MLRRISVFALSLLLSCVVTLAGCQFASPTKTTATSAPPGGVLNLYGADPTTLDPATSAEANSIEYILQIYSGLVTLDKDMAPVADIARTRRSVLMARPTLSICATVPDFRAAAS